ncbi:hypothetical protein OE88DRAFT_1654828 [Heliocybe sulcata]|uniref:Uncharacterized protein n=1 Tax=Heliocybe sulcata TaxID=5364 RepID=A0A5C3NCX0_9AGAM|nr:hypothetical protein OE88DRAFT_1654828 [Heliocybe sulcata]
MAFGISLVTVNLRRKHKTQGQDAEDAEKATSIFSLHKNLIRPLKSSRHREHVITPFMGRRFSVVHIAPQYNAVPESRPVAYQRPDGTWAVDSPDVSPTSSRMGVDTRFPHHSPSPIAHPLPRIARRVASQPEMRSRPARPQSAHSVAPAYPPGISRSPTPSSYSIASSSSAATMEQRDERLRQLRESQARRAHSRPPLPPLPPPPPYTP